MQLDVSTRLDAINYVIGSIGLAPVDSEDENNLDVAQASSAIDNVSRMIQSNRGNGWWFNRETNWQLTPDSVTGVINLPNNVVSCYRFDMFGRQVKISTRGRALYDTNTHGFDMRPYINQDGFVRMLLITQLDFDDLPQTVKDAISTTAAVRFATVAEMEVNRIKVLSDVSQEAVWAVESENTNQAKINAFNDNTMMRKFDMLGGGPNNW